MKKIMIVGAVDSGKTSLLMALNGETGQASKTQTINYKYLMIDTPGEYMENPRMYRALMSTALEARCIMFTQDSTAIKSIFPPGFALAFNCISIGIVTKIDHQLSDVERAVECLDNLGINGPIFKVSSLTGEGIQELKRFMHI
ncbi:MAG: EutP/PduV family microcompartment system protein [Sedimentibacter sp.]